MLLPSYREKQELYPLVDTSNTSEAHKMEQEVLKSIKNKESILNYDNNEESLFTLN